MCAQWHVTVRSVGSGGWVIQAVRVPAGVKDLRPAFNRVDMQPFDLIPKAMIDAVTVPEFTVFAFFASSHSVTIDNLAFTGLQLQLNETASTSPQVPPPLAG
jgi:hypothetical protein